MRRALLALALLGALASSGCLEPFRVRIDPDVKEGAPAWTETWSKVRGGGLGARSQETRYTFDPATTNPPFPGTLQVFSVRSLSRLSAEELLDLANDAVEDGAGSHAISLEGEAIDGRRTIASGVRTHWILRTGTTTQEGDVFDDEVRIRILAEVGHDGKSDTSFLAVAIVQVERTTQCPLLAACQPTRSESSWIQVAGDPEGSIEGATSSTGFIDNLVTR